MNTQTRNYRWQKLGVIVLLVLPVLFLVNLPASQAQSVVVTTQNDLEHEGEVFEFEKYGVGYTDPSPFGSGNKIVAIDTGLRRVFIGFTSIKGGIGESQRNEIEFTIPQKQYNGSEGTVGQLVYMGPFNEFGHREFYIRGAKGVRRRYVQGITKINPRYCIVNVLTSGKFLQQWQMSVATKTINPDVLRNLLIRQADPNNVNDLFDIADFFRQARNYERASQELLLIQSKFPEERERVEEERIELKQLQGRQILGEIENRTDLGQTRLAAAYAKVADNKEFAVDIRAKFDALKEVADNKQTKLQDTLQRISDLVANVGDLPASQKLAVDQFQRSLKAELSDANLPRLDAYDNLKDDNSIPNVRKLALAMSGWLLSTNNATENMAVVESLYPVKSLVLEYLADDVSEIRREAILAELAELETGNPKYIDSLLRNSKPVAAEDLTNYDGSKPIEFFIKVPGTVASPAIRSYRCIAHLPTEYDPHRKYTTIITLPGGGQSLEANLNQWCGTYNEALSKEIKSAVRNGQASRQGLIVVAVDFRNKGQSTYSYSMREHFIVTEALRESLRRFSINSDKVFLAGNFEGADAAYDIGVSHPEHWAGVLGFSGTFDKYVDHYKDNQHVGLPMYVVTGQKDKISKRGIETAASKWLKSKFKRWIDLTVVEYKGALSTSYAEEIPHALKWIQTLTRPWPEGEGFSFECKAMRPGDNYFWFFELDEIPSNFVHDPALFGVEKLGPILTMSGKIQSPNKFRLEPANVKVGRESTLWLSPEFVDFKKRVEVVGRGSFKGIVTPSNKTLLDDVLRRADVQHPYWAKLKLKRGSDWNQVE
ncbi:hypothetical protein N9Y42_08140 [Mariniblastus sp.]|nr:hypothetical protein [Mariniblastus sp.]